MGIGAAALIARQMRIALNGIDVGGLANFSRLVWISPVIGGFTGDAWLKQTVSSLTLTSKGLQNSEHELTDFYWVTVLPLTVIENLVHGLQASIAFLPQFQVNPCCALATAVSKTCHWLRQGHIDPLAPLGVMYWRPCIASARSGLKVPSGKGGQEHWHNCAYVASSYCGVVTGGEDGNWQLTAAEVDWSFFIRPWCQRKTIGQRIFGRFAIRARPIGPSTGTSYFRWHCHMFKACHHCPPSTTMMLRSPLLVTLSRPPQRLCSATRREFDSLSTAAPR